MGTITITKYILDCGVNLTIGELIALVPVIEKQLIKAIFENKAVQFQVNSLESNAIEAKKSHFWYFMGFPKAKIRHKNVLKLIAFLDTGAEINVMTQEVMEDAGLAIQRDSKLELVSYMCHSHPFLGLCKDIEIVIGELKTRHPIFVIKHGNHDLVLGQSFLNLV